MPHMLSRCQHVKRNRTNANLGEFNSSAERRFRICQGSRLVTIRGKTGANGKNVFLFRGVVLFAIPGQAIRTSRILHLESRHRRYRQMLFLHSSMLSGRWPLLCHSIVTVSSSMDSAGPNELQVASAHVSTHRPMATRMCAESPSLGLCSPQPVLRSVNHRNRAWARPGVTEPSVPVCSSRRPSRG